MLTLAFYIPSLRWMVPAGAILGSAPAFYTIWGTWRVASLVLPSRVYEKGDEFLYSLYQKLILFFFEKTLDTKIEFYGNFKEILEKHENAIVLMNHQSTVDWLMASILGVRGKSLGSIRYILKDGLKYIPLYGFYFRQHSCIYIKRSGKFKEDKMVKDLQQYGAGKTPFWMIIYPEGTRFKPNLMIKEIINSITVENPFMNIMTPRFKAFQLCNNHLKNKCAAIYDITIAYSSTLGRNYTRLVAPSLAEYLQGECPLVQINVIRYDISQVPSTEEDAKLWLQNVFKEKDRLLTCFYNNKSFEGEKHVISVPFFSYLPSLLIFSTVNWFFAFSERGPSLYWKITLFGTLTGWAWMTIRS